MVKLLIIAIIFYLGFAWGRQVTQNNVVRYQSDFQRAMDKVAHTATGTVQDLLQGVGAPEPMCMGKGQPKPCAKL